MPTTVNFSPNFFRIGTHELEVYRNGKKAILGNEYDELTQNTIRFFDTLSTGERVEGTVRGRQVFGHPGMRHYALAVATGINVLYTVPVYTPGNDSLRVFRNGKLLSLAALDYVELAPTVVRISNQIVDDNFEFIVRGENSTGAPILFEEQLTVAAVDPIITLATAYVTGTRTLEVFRNGKKLVINHGFEELTTTTVKIIGTTILGERLSFSVRAQSGIYSQNPLEC